MLPKPVAGQANSEQTADGGQLLYHCHYHDHAGNSQRSVHHELLMLRGPYVVDQPRVSTSVSPCHDDGDAGKCMVVVVVVVDMLRGNRLSVFVL